RVMCRWLSIVSTIHTYTAILFRAIIREEFFKMEEMLWFLFNSNRANVSSQRKHAEGMSLRYGVGLLLLGFENRKGFGDSTCRL
ncbi:MAG: hypothetical protein SO193_01845, partial [Sodaliphilus sp.]|nr:hypothetical protein [Sodaliphilus sp.]